MFCSCNLVVKVCVQMIRETPPSLKRLNAIKHNNTCTRFDVVTRPAFLPPTNEVWGRVMFSQVFIRPRGGGCFSSQHAGIYPATGGLFFFPACITGHMTRVASASRQMVCMGGG